MRATKTLVAIMAVALIAPVFTGCKKGPNDPMLTINGRNSRLSAEWNLQSGTVTQSFSNNATLTWEDTDCEEFGGEEFEVVESTSQTQTIAGTTMSATQTFETNVDGYFTSCGSTDGGEVEDGRSWNYTGITYDYNMTIRQDGTYEVTISYSYMDENNPLPPDNDGDAQFGATLSGSASTEGKWYWVDMDKNKEGIVFENWPWLELGIEAVYEDEDGNGECDFDYTFVDGIDIWTDDMTFAIDQLKAKEMILKCEMTDNGSSTRLTDEYESLDDNFDDIDCIATENSNYTSNVMIELTFESDGKNVSGDE